MNKSGRARSANAYSPLQLRCVLEIPKTSVGKIDKKRIRQGLS